jgi:hypothetical protein
LQKLRPLIRRLDDAKLLMMTGHERRKRIQEILDKDNEVAAALTEARELSSITVGAARRVDIGVGTSIEGLRMALDGLAAANEHNLVVNERAMAVNAAVGRAIAAAREANRLTMALLNEM